MRALSVYEVSAGARNLRKEMLSTRSIPAIAAAAAIEKAVGEMPLRGISFSTSSPWEDEPTRVDLVADLSFGQTLSLSAWRRERGDVMEGMKHRPSTVPSPVAEWGSLKVRGGKIAPVTHLVQLLNEMHEAVPLAVRFWYHAEEELPQTDMSVLVSIQGKLWVKLTVAGKC